MHKMHAIIYPPPIDKDHFRWDCFYLNRHRQASWPATANVPERFPLPAQAPPHEFGPVAVLRAIDVAILRTTPLGCYIFLLKKMADECTPLDLEHKYCTTIHLHIRNVSVFTSAPRGPIINIHSMGGAHSMISFFGITTSHKIAYVEPTSICLHS